MQDIAIEIVKPTIEFITPKYIPEWKRCLEMIEECGRVSHRSEGRMVPGSAIPFIEKIAMQLGHESIIEHFGLTFRCVCDRSTSHQWVRHRLSTYCITGDTELVAFSAPGRSPKRWTIEQLYNWQDDPKRKGRLKLIALRSVNRDDIIVPGKIGRVVDMGLQQTSQVKTRCNRSIRCTDNEWFMTDDGWQRLHELSVGDRIKVNGDLAYRDEDWLRDHYLVQNMQRVDVAALAGVSNACIGKWIQKHGLQKPHTQYPNRQAGHGVPGMHGDNGRAVMAERMTGEGNHSWKGDEAKAGAGRRRAHRKYAALGTCDCCERPATHRHHVDENPLNNTERNVIPLCDTCHASHHIGQAVVVVHSSPITSILACGIERTYDIEMDTMGDELRNYVANGFLVHNTQESQRYCDYSKKRHGKTLQVVMPPSYAGQALWGETVRWADGTNPVPVVVGGASVWKMLDSLGCEPNAARIAARWCAKQLNAYGAYLEDCGEGIPAEDARSHLSNACKTEIYTTSNFRSWRHFFDMRHEDHAQWQIRSLAGQILQVFKEEIPVLVADKEVRKEWII